MAGDIVLDRCNGRTRLLLKPVPLQVIRESELPTLLSPLCMESQDKIKSTRLHSICNTIESVIAEGIRHCALSCADSLLGHLTGLSY